jgi:hypothetical protein
MSDQLSKPIIGQVTFPIAADRRASLANLHLAGSARALTIASSAVTANAALASSFTVTAAANFTLTVSNLDDGQTIRVLVAASGGAVVVTVSPNDGDTIASIADTKKAILTITKFGSVVYVIKSTVVA